MRRLAPELELERTGTVTSTVTLVDLSEVPG